MSVSKTNLININF